MAVAVAILLLVLLLLLLLALLLLQLLRRLEFQGYLKGVISLGVMMMRMMTALSYKQIQAIRHLKVSFSMVGIIIMITILTAFVVMVCLQDQIIIPKAA